MSLWCLLSAVVVVSLQKSDTAWWLEALSKPSFEAKESQPREPSDFIKECLALQAVRDAQGRAAENGPSKLPIWQDDDGWCSSKLPVVDVAEPWNPIFWQTEGCDFAVLWPELYGLGLDHFVCLVLTQSFKGARKWVCEWAAHALVFFPSLIWIGLDFDSTKQMYCDAEIGESWNTSNLACVTWFTRDFWWQWNIHNFFHPFLLGTKIIKHGI